MKNQVIWTPLTHATTCSKINFISTVKFDFIWCMNKKCPNHLIFFIYRLFKVCKSTWTEWIVHRMSHHKVPTTLNLRTVIKGHFRTHTHIYTYIHVCVYVCSDQFIINLWRDILLGLNIAQDDSCSLCTTGHESRDHLSFSCEFSSYIWFLCKLKLGLDPTSSGTIVEECKLIQSQFTRKHKAAMLAKVVLRDVSWHIWNERNSTFFCEQKATKIMVFRRLYEDVHTLMQTCHWKWRDRAKYLLALSNWGIHVSEWESFI